MNVLKRCGALIAVALLISCGDDPNARKRFFRYPVERCTKTNFTKNVHKASCKFKKETRSITRYSINLFDCTHGCGNRPCGSSFGKRTTEYDGIICKCELSKDITFGIFDFDEKDFTTKEEYQKYIHVCFPYEPLP